MPSMTFSRGDFEPSPRTFESVANGLLRWCGIRTRPHLLVVGDRRLLAGDDGLSEGGRLMSLNPLLQVEDQAASSDAAGLGWVEQLAQARRRRYDAIVVLLAVPPAEGEADFVKALTSQLQTARARAAMVIVVPPPAVQDGRSATGNEGLQQLCHLAGAQCVSWAAEEADAAVLVEPGVKSAAGVRSASVVDHGAQRHPASSLMQLADHAQETGTTRDAGIVRSGGVAMQLLQQTRLSQILFS